MKLDTLQSGAQKHQEGKLKMELVPPESIEAIAQALTYGANKYSAFNWEKGIPFLTSYASALRHLLAWRAGIDTDPESGLHHIDHAVCNLAMLATQIRRGRADLDDRPTKETN